nr:galectin-2 isoform X3 [Microcebus murinus]
MSEDFEIRNMNMKPGTTLKIKGRIPDDANSFAINLGQGSDELNLHFNPRFTESIIVCNTKDGSSWGQEQRDNHQCFTPGSEVKVRSKGKAVWRRCQGEGPKGRACSPGHACWQCLCHQALPWPIPRASCLLDTLPNSPTGDHNL